MVVDMCCVYPEVLGEQRSSHPVIVLTGGWDHKGLEGQSKVVGQGGGVAVTRSMTRTESKSKK
jgi:hypothetical protein